jgi:hypothetical protein
MRKQKAALQLCKKNYCGCLNKPDKMYQKYLKDI